MLPPHLANASLKAIVDLDVLSMRAIHRLTNPQQDPGTDWDILCALHGCRTRLDNVPIKDRQYSHAWLSERGMPSDLPDHLKPEQIVPRVVEGVGIIVAASSEELEPAALLVRREMEKVVLDAYADSTSPDPQALQARMMEARKKELRKLILPDKATG